MNSSTNPRKFAEKIAKLHQKEAEQTMAFEQIMAEVIVATRVGTLHGKEHVRTREEPPFHFVSFNFRFFLFVLKFMFEFDFFIDIFLCILSLNYKCCSNATST